MQSLTQRIENAVISRPMMACGVAVFCGVLIGLFNPFTKLQRSNIPGLKEGVMIVVPTTSMLDPAADLKLRGSKVVIAHRTQDGHPPCKGAHVPLNFSANEKVAILSGNLFDIEGLLMSIQTDDLKRLDIVEPKDNSMPLCSQKVKIVYGEEG